MEAWLLYAAGVAIVIAILMWLFKGKPKSQSSQTSCSSPPAVGVMGVKPKGPPPPMPAKTQAKVDKKYRNRKYRSRKGWRAPAGYYFDEDDCLFTDTGDLIGDMIMIAHLCGIDNYVPSVADGYTAEEVAEHEHEAAVHDAAVVLTSPESEVTPNTDFSSLHTAPSTPVSAPEPAPTPSYEPPAPSYSEPSSYSGGGSDYSGGGGD